MKPLNLLAILFLFFLPAPLLFSQSVNVTVKGQVIDSLANEPISFATIKFAGKDNPDVAVKAMAADEDGRFSFTINQQGEYILTVFYVGKDNFSQDVAIGSDNTVDMGVLRMRDNGNALSEVVVSADKPIVRVELDKITYSMESDPESQTNNVLEMLKKVPMVTVDGEESIQLKGSSNFKVYMNGKPSNMLDKNAKDILRSMPANSVKDIEIITDPGAKYDAEGVAGIINIITHKQTSMGGYTATLNASGDGFGGFGGGAYVMMKYGKIGFTGNYNYSKYKSPEGTSSTFRDIFDSPEERYLFQRGTSKYGGDYQFGNGELSFELDTLNLINVGFNRFNGANNGRNKQEYDRQDDMFESNQIYNRFATNRGNWGQTGINVDWQRTFSKKDQLLTTSYRYNYNPDDSESDNRHEGILNFYDRHDRQYTDANSKEHTIQIDFTTPFGKKHSIETGLKYILRLNNSTSGYEDLDMANNQWIPRPDVATNKFKHRQDVGGAYAGYSFKMNKWGAKAGLRYEYTRFDAEFPLDDARNFDADFSNLVPSLTTTYQLKPAQTLRLGYNLRISRPGIWALNPYVNSSDSNYISYGNPDLDVTKSHSFSLNYSFFNPKFNMNANMSYNFSGNSIESFTDVSDGISYTTYDNIGKAKRLYLSFNSNWSITNKLRLNNNLGGSYTDIRTTDQRGLKSHGYGLNANVGLQYTMPWDMNISANGGYFSPYIHLQGKEESYHYNSLSVQKNLMDKRLNIRFYISNPFEKERTTRYSQSSPNFFFESESTYRMRRFGIHVSFRFGELKEQIKKVQRGIVNDDSSGGGGGGQQGGGTPSN